MQALPTKDSNRSSSSSITCLVPSSVTVQEKGSRNKRKFRADPPSVESAMVIPPPQNEGFGYEFSAGNLENTPAHGQSSPCDMRNIPRGHFDGLKLDLELSSTLSSSEVGSNQQHQISEEDEYQEADWSDLTETQLQELVLGNLEMMFRSAIQKIVAFGYTEEVATKAVLRSGLCYGCKDTVSNIVDNTLAFLRNGQVTHLLREHYFEDLLQLGKYILAELVCVLREIRPFFSTGDAMWCLLICDMNVSHACAMNSEPFGGFVRDGGSQNPIYSEAQLKTETKISESNLPNPCKPIPVAPCSHMQFKARSITDVSSITRPKSSHGGLVTEKESTSSASDILHKSFCVTGTSQPSVSEEKFICSRKAHCGSTKREHLLRQKSLLLERNYGMYGSKGSSRAEKRGLGDLILDNKLIPLSGSSLKNNSCKINKAMGVDSPQENGNHNLPANTEPSLAKFNLESVNTRSPLPKTNMQSALPAFNSQFPLTAANASPASLAADTELSLSLTTRRSLAPVHIRSIVEPPNFSLAGVPYDNSLSQWIPQDKKDEIILKFAPRVRELQSLLQEWNEWANQKVMQAARRLSKDKAELKTLRQEREEVERLEKEKRTLEENTMKKLSEMENALCKASGQVERANSAVRRLEVENAALRLEMEAAKYHAEESVASCEEVAKREKKTLITIQSREKQKSMFQEELMTEKCKVTQLKQELEQAIVLEEQSVERWGQEKKARDLIVMHVEGLRKEREQIEASTKSKEELIKLRAENNLQKYKDDIQKLEKEISQLRLKTDSQKIAALRRGISGSVVSTITDNRNGQSPKASQPSYISEMLTDIYDNKSTGVKRDRECVMCLSEEMSVVFLPCAHQVVCTTCNELHEKQGMKDCPSCRSAIQQRIPVRYRHS